MRSSKRKRLRSTKAAAGARTASPSKRKGYTRQLRLTTIPTTPPPITPPRPRSPSPPPTSPFTPSPPTPSSGTQNTKATQLTPTPTTPTPTHTTTPIATPAPAATPMTATAAPACGSTPVPTATLPAKSGQSPLHVAWVLRTPLSSCNPGVPSPHGRSRRTQLVLDVAPTPCASRRRSDSPRKSGSPRKSSSPRKSVPTPQGASLLDFSVSSVCATPKTPAAATPASTAAPLPFLFSPSPFRLGPDWGADRDAPVAAVVQLDLPLPLPSLLPPPPLPPPPLLPPPPSAAATTEAEEIPCTQQLELSQDYEPTQPLASSGGTPVKYSPPAGVWGKLVSLAGRYSNITLSGTDEILLGRSPAKCKYVFEEPSVSEVHCALSMMTVCDTLSSVVVEDRSSNGTWVNGDVVGRGNRKLLRHRDELSLAPPQKDNISFVFYDAKAAPAAHPGITNVYDVRHEIGRGNFSHVKLCIDPKTGDKFAVKIIDKVKHQEHKDKIFQEVKILEQLKQLHHPNIITIIDLFDSKRELNIVLELVEGGDLQEYLLRNRVMPEKKARSLFRQLCEGVLYLHSFNIIHRDLKPANILLGGTEEKPVPKISDFGISKILDQEGEFMTTICGTPQYAAPELLCKLFGSGSGMPSSAHAGYGKEVDLWSLGAILYHMLGGYPPFSNEDGDESQGTPLPVRIMRGNLTFAGATWREVSEPGALHHRGNISAIIDNAGAPH
eukprot:TRINITY_DN1036_c0_g1_i2.p1 TRINITY_DN1036_c0_g1~~TRINITY_DN1036_c0_g1_i2.p1  ORF type:complete len:722 (+),score=170.38 TRINITY_DN1036_c0_g1_i2:91-2256(+)